MTWRKGSLALLVLLLAVALATAWRLRGDDVPPAAEPAVPLSHVHGLGLDPADGSLIIATHYGSWRLAADATAVSRVGTTYQDTMGFTVVGAGHYLGSGHPDVQGRLAGEPTDLGLIESTDAGRSWRSRSLAGDVDFHGLAVVGEQVYGWDSGSGALMRSVDKTSWETQATLELFSFVVDPKDGEHLVAATPTGLQDSRDSGRTWSASDGPGLLVLGWADTGGLWGIDAEGQTWQRTSDGWDRRGRLPGSPQALVATADALYAAAHDADEVTGIYRSVDGGETWELRYRDIV